MSNPKEKFVHIDKLVRLRMQQDIDQLRIRIAEGNLMTRGVNKLIDAAQIHIDQIEGGIAPYVGLPVPTIQWQIELARIRVAAGMEGAEEELKNAQAKLRKWRRKIKARTQDSL